MLLSNIKKKFMNAFFNKTIKKRKYNSVIFDEETIKKYEILRKSGYSVDIARVVLPK